MTVLLLANVGNHDLELKDPSLLPDKGDPRWWAPRRIGEEIQANLKHYAGQLSMPLIGATVQWLLESEKVTPASFQVVLFASDQPPADTVQEEWLKDTLPIAQVIRTVLTQEPFRLVPRQIRIEAIQGIPADYANMLAFYTRTLPQIAQKVGADAQVYLEVSGGTPAMTSMLIVAGVEVFGERVRTLYLDRGATQPYEVRVARELFARKTRDILRNQIRLHVYTAALHTLSESGDLVTPDARQRHLLAALLDYADRRLAFDFERALTALQEARGLAVGVPQARIGRWLRELESRDDTAALLSELLHSARLKLQAGDYADFTQRLFRYQEASFRHMAEQMGLKCGKSSEYARQTWVKNQTQLNAFLSTYVSPQTGESNPVDLGRSLNRYSLGAIVDYYMQHDPSWARWRGTADDLHALSSVAELRNKGLSGHGFKGIGRPDLEAAYGATVDALLENLARIYEALFGQPPGDNPYTAVNELILDLVQANL
jgi:hypothetical protein